MKHSLQLSIQAAWLIGSLSFAAAAHAGTSGSTCATLNNADDCIDLTSVGSVATKEGATFYVPSVAITAGTGLINSFLRTQRTGPGDNDPSLNRVEKGYNTDGTLEFNSKPGPFTRALPAQQVLTNNTVTIDGVPFFEFVLDINQQGSSPFLEMSTLQLWLTSNPNLTGYSFGANATKVYDLGATDTDTRILLDYNNYAGSGKLDLVALFPASLIADSNGNAKQPYIVLYNEFNLYNDGFEEWARKKSGTFTGKLCQKSPQNPICTGGGGSVPIVTTPMLLMIGMLALLVIRRRQTQTSNILRA